MSNKQRKPPVHALRKRYLVKSEILTLIAALVYLCTGRLSARVGTTIDDARGDETPLGYAMPNPLGCRRVLKVHYRETRLASRDSSERPR